MAPLQVRLVLLPAGVVQASGAWAGPQMGPAPPAAAVQLPALPPSLPLPPHPAGNQDLWRGRTLKFERPEALTCSTACSSIKARCQSPGHPTSMGGKLPGGGGDGGLLGSLGWAAAVAVAAVPPGVASHSRTSAETEVVAGAGWQPWHSQASGGQPARPRRRLCAGLSASRRTASG